MTKIVSAAATGHLTVHGKRVVAESMCAKGKAFLGAAILLRRHSGYEFVVLHLICQGIEILLKGLLLVADYDEYKPKLKKLGHNLVRIVEEALQAADAKPLRPELQAELDKLNKLYSQHLLRYGSGYDILVDPTTIPSKRVLRRVAALLRLIERKGIVQSNII